MKPVDYLKLVTKLKSFSPILYRFLEKVNLNEETSCWEWNSSERRDYGRFKLNGKFEGSHRVSYELFIGEIGNLIVCHKCDNPKCVNPAHLFLGTYSDNSKDAYNKGRIIIPKENQFKKGHKPRRGSLSKDIVVEIKKDISKGQLSLVKISDKYNVKYQTIRDISSGRSYINV